MKLSEIDYHAIIKEIALKFYAHMPQEDYQLVIDCMEAAIKEAEQSSATDFLEWIIKYAKIEVLSADLIEVHGFGENGMCPVMSRKELYAAFLKYPNGISTPPQQKES